MTEQKWVDYTLLGSEYEIEMETRSGRWRHRPRRRSLGGFRCDGSYSWPPEFPWVDGPPPDFKP